MLKLQLLFHFVFEHLLGDRGWSLLYAWSLDNWCVSDLTCGGSYQRHGVLPAEQRSPRHPMQLQIPRQWPPQHILLHPSFSSCIPTPAYEGIQQFLSQALLWGPGQAARFPTLQGLPVKMLQPSPQPAGLW